jgi:hypothetical protein
MRTGFVALAALFVLIGCDPVFALNIQQTLQPVPTTCVDSALLMSPHVVRAKQVPGRKGTKTYELTLTDFRAADYRPSLEIPLSSRGDSAVAVRVVYEWMGSSQLAAPKEELVARWGVEVVEDLRRACAPATAPHVTCKYAALSRRRRCVAPPT